MAKKPPVSVGFKGRRNPIPMVKREDKLLEILKKNKNVPFVDRILNASKYPVRKNEDGSISTHLMASGDIDGKPAAWPTLQYVNGKWVQDPTDAIMGDNFIFFDTMKEAEDFGLGSWKKHMQSKVPQKRK